MNSKERETVIAILRQLVGQVKILGNIEGSTNSEYAQGWMDCSSRIVKRIEFTISELTPISNLPYMVMRTRDDRPMSCWGTLAAANVACRNLLNEGVACYVAHEVKGDE